MTDANNSVTGEAQKPLNALKRRLGCAGFFVATVAFWVDAVSMISSINYQIPLSVANGIVSQLACLTVIYVLAQGLQIVQQLSDGGWLAYKWLSLVLFALYGLGCVMCFWAGINFHIQRNAVAGCAGLVSFAVMLFGYRWLSSKRKQGL